MTNQQLSILGGLALCVALVGATMMNTSWNRMLDEQASRVCRVEASSPSATIIVKIDKPEPCDPLEMAREARRAVFESLAEVQQDAQN